MKLLPNSSKLSSTRLLSN